MSARSASARRPASTRLALPDEDQREWADSFADWCAERYGFFQQGEDPHRMPSFKRAWPAFWKEPVDFGDGPDPDAEEDE